MPTEVLLFSQMASFSMPLFYCTCYVPWQHDPLSLVHSTPTCPCELTFKVISHAKPCPSGPVYVPSFLSNTCHIMSNLYISLIFLNYELLGVGLPPFLGETGGGDKKEGSKGDRCSIHMGLPASQRHCQPAPPWALAIVWPVSISNTKI